MKTWLHKFRRSKGVSLIEFSVVAPVLLLIMFAVIEYSIMFAAMVLMNNATAEGARQASLFQNGFTAEDYRADAVAAMSADLPEFIANFTSRVELAGVIENCGGQTCLRLTATYPDYANAPLIDGYVSALGLMPANLTAESYTRLTITSVGL
ncbi:MAG: TadE family protein [Limnobacter sp.]|nr:TadE family protein [Limnobacter sp.]